MKKGIDVSTYQGYPDWSRVKSSGVDFAIIKAGQGRAESSNSYLFQDSKFSYNITNATAVGIPCGVYYYFTAQNDQEAKREAQHFVSIINPYKHLITLYAAIDVESIHLKGLLKHELSRLVEVFCVEVEKAGYKPIVYTNPDWLRNRLDGISNRPLWLALWRNKNNVPSGYGDMKIWQWGESTVSGIINNVDSNFGYFTDVSTTAPTPVVPPASPHREKIKTGDRVRVENPINYDTGKPFKRYFDAYDVIQVKENRVVIGIGKTITAAVHIEFLEKI